jgi:transposase
MRDNPLTRRPASSRPGRRMQAETFVGLDIHRNVVVATAVDPLGRLIDRSSLGPTDVELITYLRGLPGTKRVVLEACTMWEHFYDAAVASGAEVVLSHPYKTRLIAEASLKSDRVDSEALATLLRLHALPTAYAPEERIRETRRVVRDRQFYRRQEKAVRSHVYALLMAKGILYPKGILGRKRQREALRELHLPIVDRGLDALRDLEARTRELDLVIHAAFQESPDAQLLATVPGIGELTSVSLTAFLCPIERFANFDQVSSYAGLCPTNHQSADTSFHGRLKKDCNHLLQSILIEASWTHRQTVRTGLVAKVGRRIARRKGATRGAVASAHALLRLVYAILKRKTPYFPHAPERPSCKVVPATPV